MKVALVHDYLNQYGGAERVLQELHAIWPEAPVFAAIHDPAKMPSEMAGWDIRPTWLNRIPHANTRHQALLPLYPLAFHSLDLRGYDVVVSSSSGFAHATVTDPGTTRICYCHSPPRFLWSYNDYARKERLGGLARSVGSCLAAVLRQWDRAAAQRTDSWIATSQVIQDRLRLVYDKDSTIIPPSIDTTRFEVGSGPGRYFLMLMRLVGWKRPDIAVEACTRLGLPLVVAGDGRELERLKSVAGPDVRFVGRVNDAEMKVLYRDCKALILPSEEDFGITPLEAMASGRPVIAFRSGGALDTLKPGLNGLFFDEQTAASLETALQGFDESAFDPRAIRRSCEGYDSLVFRRRMRDFVDAEIERGQVRRARSSGSLAYG